jgi:hypothetical protein
VAIAARISFHKPTAYPRLQGMLAYVPIEGGRSWRPGGLGYRSSASLADKESGFRRHLNVRLSCGSFQLLPVTCDHALRASVEKRTSSRGFTLKGAERRRDS